MARARFTVVPLASIVAFAILVACESTMNLGDGFGDGGSLTCESACDRLITTCNLLAVDQRSACVAQCRATGDMSNIECVTRTACPDISTACARRTDAAQSGVDAAILEDLEIRTCQSSCDSSHFYDCITDSELSACAALCASAPAEKRNTYQWCASSAGGSCTQSRSCFEVFRAP
jgi:hypothetical protein